MHRHGVFHFLLLAWLLAGAFVLRANPAYGDPRKEKLYSEFIAPCCWSENLLAHRSPKADEMRGEINQLIAAGRTDEEIRKALVARYSLRVMALPDGARAQWLWWATPVAALLGLAAIVFFVRRSLHTPRPPRPAPAGANLPDLPDTEWM
ncbi:MAG: cytochrome c-type biogenesis protein CcmH [Bryobacterales bacterium]|nr:cytochrome c-type biogenesis protein CcmH [Bryobacterales bacterium]